MELDLGLFIVDAPVSFADGDSPSSEVQLAKLGNFRHPKYGPFKVTREIFDSFIRNFAGISQGELGIDLDHAPEKGGSTAAAGWIKSLEVRGSELWGSVEWTPLGREAIENKIYRFMSPTWKWARKDDSGKDLGPALIGAGLTNRPFFNRMAAVSLSETFSLDDFALAEEEPSDSRRRMDREKLIEIFGLDAEATDEQILTAATESREKADKAPGEDEVVVKADEIPSKGDQVMTAAEVSELKADAAKGVEASEELSGMRFDTAFKDAVRETRAVPAQREGYEQIFELDEEKCLKMLDEHPKMASTSPAGGAGDPVTPSADPEDREKFDEAVRARMEEKDEDYRTAAFALAEELDGEGVVA